MADLEAQGLFFPGGHCKGVCLGGYLLQGGYGWNSRVYGPACESVVGLDVITADGEQIHCDADQHPDLYWAARGAGPGFFGVVTSFYLKLYPRPAVCGTSVYLYPFDLADEVFTWARAVGAEVDPRVELQAVASRGEPNMGIDAPVISFASPAFADSDEEAEKALALFGTCPVADKALVKVPYMPTDLPSLVRRRDEPLPVRPPLRGGQHVDVGVGRGAAARASGRSSTRCPRIRRTSCG